MSAKELLDRYSEYLNQTRFDPTTESSTYQVIPNGIQLIPVQQSLTQLFQKEDETRSIYTNGDEYYQDQLISNIVPNFNDSEFEANNRTDKEVNYIYDREYEADWDSKKLDIYNTSMLGYITLN